MAFNNLAVSGGVMPRAPQALPDEVFVALYKTGKTDGSLTLSVRLGGKVMRQLGWVRGDFVEISEGNGEEAGLLYLAPGKGRRLTDPSGKLSDPDAARLYILTKAFVYHSFPGFSQTGEKVNYHISRKKIVIELPMWAKPVRSRQKNNHSVAAV